jgi:hypothetical protein
MKKASPGEAFQVKRLSLPLSRRPDRFAGLRCQPRLFVGQHEQADSYAPDHTVKLENQTLDAFIPGAFLRCLLTQSLL